MNMMAKIAAAELKKFSEGEGLFLFQQGRELIAKSGIIALLRAYARPFSIDNGANIYQAAYRNAYIEGYNACLDEVLHFEEMYVNPAQDTTKKIEPTFGGFKLALAKGDLKEGDLK